MGPKTIWFKKILDYNILNRSQLIFQIRNPGHEIMITVFKINQNKSWNLISINSILKIKIKKKIKMDQNNKSSQLQSWKVFFDKPLLQDLDPWDQNCYFIKFLVLELHVSISYIFDDFHEWFYSAEAYLNLAHTFKNMIIQI
jgi:hypothetical protein